VKFEDFGLDERLLQALRDLQFESPTRVQDQVIPIVLRGQDTLARSQTGTGKTAAFGLPILHGLLQKQIGRAHV